MGKTNPITPMTRPLMRLQSSPEKETTMITLCSFLQELQGVLPKINTPASYYSCKHGTSGPVVLPCRSCHSRLHTAKQTQFIKQNARLEYSTSPLPEQHTKRTKQNLRHMIVSPQDPEQNSRHVVVSLRVLLSQPKLHALPCYPPPSTTIPDQPLSFAATFPSTATKPGLPLHTTSPITPPRLLSTSRGTIDEKDRHSLPRSQQMSTSPATPHHQGTPTQCTLTNTLKAVTLDTARLHMH